METNIVFFIMDSVSYSQFREAETPNIDELSEKTIKAYSTGTYTLPSMKSIVHGILPSSEKETLFTRSEDWHRPIPNQESFKNYSTAAFSGNPLFTDFSFPSFDSFHSEFGIQLEDSAEGLMEAFEERMEIITQPFFLCFLFVYTHHPFRGIDFQRGTQREAITYLDEKLRQVYDRIPENTEIYVTSDHGEIFDESGSSLGHNPKVEIEFPTQLGKEELLTVFSSKIVK